MSDLTPVVRAIAASLGKSLTTEQMANIAVEALAFISGKVSTATWAEAGRAGDAEAAKIEKPDDAERLFREKK